MQVRFTLLVAIGMHYVCYASSNTMLILLVVKLVGKYYPVNVKYSPPSMFIYKCGKTLETKHGSWVEARDAEFGIYPRTDKRLGMKDPQVAF